MREAEWKVIVGDARRSLRSLPKNHFHTCPTSPPYWGLRSYLPDDHPDKALEMGLEESPSAFIAEMVDLFAEVHRVLRKDGTLWLNIGDCYAGSPNGRSASDTKAAGNDDRTFRDKPYSTAVEGFKPKDLCMMPHRLAIALQEWGWWVRCDIVWSKPNPMPESTRDRPTRSHEYVFLLTKSPVYFCDMEAIRERITESSKKRINQATFEQQTGGEKDYAHGGNANRSIRRSLENFAKSHRTDKQRGHSRRHAGFNDRWDGMTHEEQGANGRNKRSVWEIATYGNPDAHFATFPPDLVRPCILAGTSERGCCPACGAPQKRITEPTEEYAELLGGDWSDEEQDQAEGRGHFDMGDGKKSPQRPIKRNTAHVTASYRTVGWEATCKCGETETVPCRVLDPFCGSGTTGVVSRQHGRDFVGLELYDKYARMSRRNIGNALRVGLRRQSRKATPQISFEELESTLDAMSVALEESL